MLDYSILLYHFYTKHEHMTYSNFLIKKSLKLMKHFHVHIQTPPHTHTHTHNFEIVLLRNFQCLRIIIMLMCK